MSLNRAQFLNGSGGIIRLKAVLDHGGMGRGDKIEVDRLIGMHGNSSFKPKIKATTLDFRSLGNR
jgi:hypothetical protein